MPISLRARFWRMLLRNTFMTKKRSIAEYRANDIKSAKLMGGISKTVRIEKIEIDGLHTEWIIPANANPKKVILYLHGGGYVTGSVDSYRMMCSLLATYTGIKTLTPNYRLAPEHPFPAALDDALKTYRWLLKQGHSPTDIIICGDSAGGGLSLATVIALRDNNESLPAATVCLSPWTDLTLKNKTHVTKAKVESMLRADILSEWASAYAGELNLNNPLISPIHADLHGLPPLFIQVGCDEVLLDDSILLAEKAKAAGVDVTLKIHDDMWHVWMVLGELIPESKKAFEEIALFISICTSSKQTGESTGK